MDEYQHLRHSADEAERLRRVRHAAAFMGDCGVATCDICHPPTLTPEAFEQVTRAFAAGANEVWVGPAAFRPAMQGIPARDTRDEDRWQQALQGGRAIFHPERARSRRQYP